MNKRSFKSNDFNFRPTTMAAALMRAGHSANPHFAREPKAMEVHAEGRRVVVEIPSGTPGAFGKRKVAANPMKIPA